MITLGNDSVLYISGDYMTVKTAVTNGASLGILTLGAEGGGLSAAMTRVVTNSPPEITKVTKVCKCKAQVSG